MKLISGITAFFTTVADKVIAWLSAIKERIEKFASNRVVLITSALAVVKLFYNRCVEMINYVLSEIAKVNSAGDPSAATSGLSSVLEFGNTIFPISETLQVFTLLLNLYVVVLLLRLYIKFSPKFFGIGK